MIKFLLKLKNSFLTNLPWKIAAFFMAFVLWFLVINVEDPARTEPVDVRLELRNEGVLALGAAEGIHLENLDNLRAQVIRLQVHGTSRNIEAARNNLRAYIDLSTFDIRTAAERGDTLNVPVQLEGYGGIQIFSRTPSSVPLVMDTIITVELPVEIYPEVYVDDNYFLLLRESIDISPATAMVTGPSSYVNRIARMAVDADVNVEDATSTIYKEDLEIAALDAAGDRVTSPHLQFENRANVELPIYTRHRVQILEPPVHASPPPGFGIHSINWNPQWLEVAGEADVIAALGPILLTPIPEGLIMHNTENFTEPYDIRVFLPPGVFLIDQRHHTIYVDVFVEPFVEQEFTIPIEEIVIIGLPEGAEVLTEEITIRLSALQTVMAAVGVGNITATAVVANIDLEEGYNEISLVFALPARVSLVETEEPLAITIYFELVEDEEDDGDEENGENGIEEDDDEEAGD